MDVAKFNLLEEPWIPVLKVAPGGKEEKEIGLLGALLNAHTITRIETPSPLEEAALHRLLLAVLHRALMGPKDKWEALEWWEEGRFPEDPIRAYLEEYQDRFFLFHPEAPFLQVADLPDTPIPKENPGPRPWTTLLPERSSGNNPTLFDHTTEEDVPKATYAQAARALLVHQTFTPGGLLRRFGVPSAKGAPLAGAAAFLPTGENLFQTLLLNLVPYSSTEAREDAPVWEAPPLRLRDVREYRTKWPLSGRTRVYTWPSRGVRLLDEGNGVRLMAYGPGVEPIPTPFRDPMVAYRSDAKGNPLPLRLDVDRSFWRDFSSMLPMKEGSPPASLAHADEILRTLKEEGEKGSRSLRVLGQVSDQAKVLDVRREVYPLPRGILSDVAKLNLSSALEQAEDLGQGLRALAFVLAREVLGNRDPQELSSFARSLPLGRLYWHALDGAFPGFLARVGEGEALGLWQEALKRAALEAWAATRLFLGTEARHLKAVAEGERVLGRLLGELKEVVK